MTQKELKRLKRSDLLKMLIELKKRNDELETELEKTREQLISRKIEIEKSGSIAEASLKINRVFEAAQKAADQYLENIKNEIKE